MVINYEEIVTDHQERSSLSEGKNHLQLFDVVFMYMLVTPTLHRKTDAKM